jgi:hypothetical protein
MIPQTFSQRARLSLVVSDDFKHILKNSFNRLISFDPESFQEITFSKITFKRNDERSGRTVRDEILSDFHSLIGIWTLAQRPGNWPPP